MSQFKNIILNLGSKSGLISSALYTLVPVFYREHKAVMGGRLLYFKSTENPVGSVAHLRRNIHRLEKGLVLRPRRIPFALDYIEETVDLYTRVLQRGSAITNEQLWARDVLHEYFDVCGNESRVSPYKNSFDKIEHPSKDLSETFLSITNKRSPYAKENAGKELCSYEDFKNLCIKRRSTRSFQPKQPPRSLIDKAIECAQLAPSACNKQPYKFLVFDKKEDISLLASLAEGTKGFHDQIPILIVVTASLADYHYEKDRHVIYIDSSLAIMSFMHAAETLGVSTCALNWSGTEFREKQFYSYVPSVAEHERPVMFIAVGYASSDCEVPFSSRKELDMVRVLNPPVKGKAS
jgi:nitroreductase